MADPEVEKNALKWVMEPKKRWMGCMWYLYDAYEVNSDSHIDFIEEATYNTKDRVRNYLRYNRALSGGVYGTENSYKVESSCDFNVTKALEADQ